MGPVLGSQYLGPGQGGPGPWRFNHFEVAWSSFVANLMENLQNCGALVNSILGVRGRIPVEAQGPARFAKWHLDFMKVVRGLVTLRSLRQHSQDLDEDYIRAPSLLSADAGINLELTLPYPTVILREFVLSHVILAPGACGRMVLSRGVAILAQAYPHQPGTSAYLLLALLMQ